MKPKHPCYDETTHTDCPRRKAGCATTCPEWAEYDKQRQKIYAERKATGLATATADATLFKHKSKRLKTNQRLNRIKRSR